MVLFLTYTAPRSCWDTESYYTPCTCVICRHVYIANVDEIVRELPSALFPMVMSYYIGIAYESTRSNMHQGLWSHFKWCYERPDAGCHQDPSSKCDCQSCFTIVHSLNKVCCTCYSCRMFWSKMYRCCLRCSNLRTTSDPNQVQHNTYPVKANDTPVCLKLK